MKTMKRIVASAICLISALGLSAQPKIGLQPQKTVFLYQEKPVKIDDPVQGKKKEALGLEMKEKSGITAPETGWENGNICNIAENARFDLYFPKKPNGQMVIVCPGGGYFFVSSCNSPSRSVPS